MGQPVPRLLVLHDVNTTNAEIITRAKTRIFFIKLLFNCVSVLRNANIRWYY